MISIDDHPPPDPSSSDYQSHNHHQQQISHDLKINSDEKAPASVSEIDLKSPDADLDDTNNPLPNFSIRDYVFSSRSKNVACNWPFSPKSLQLCLKHGLKNLLPPFQPLDLLRDNSSVSRCTLENRLPNEEIVSSFGGKPTQDQLKAVPSDGAKSNGELALESVSTNSSGSKGDKESQSILEEDLAHTKSKEKPSASSHKAENTSMQTTIKKSRLVMKSNLAVEPVEEVTPNSFIFSETMASKVCPVCKTFSSSSNTTLNAHIDQCLSTESSMRWAANPKVIVKHRIKPKTRLMADIYETAPRCTVEELDRRNGTSWATNSSFPAEEFQFQGGDEKEEPRVTTVNPEVADHEGDVYIDADGTKVRILSVPKSGSSEDNHGARKLLKGVKGSKIAMGKKKSNIHKQKHHHKYLKLSPNSRKSCSPKPHRGAYEARGGRDDVADAGNCSKNDRGKEPLKAQVLMKMDDLAVIRPPWACSKRTGLVKKFSGKDRKLDLQGQATKGLLIESDKSSSGCDLRTPPSSFDNMATSQSRKKTRTSSPLRGQPLTTSRMVEFRSPLLTKRSSKHLRKEGTRLHDDCEGPPDACPSHHTDGADIRSKSSKLSSLRKNLSIPGTTLILKTKLSAVKKSRVNCLLYEKSVVGPSPDSSKEKYTMEEDVAARKNEETRICGEDRLITLNSANGEPSVGLETAMDDSSLDVEYVRHETPSNREQVCIVRASSVIDAEGSFMGLSNSFNPEFSKLVNQPNNKFDSRECVEPYQDQLCSTNRAPDGTNIFGNDIGDDTGDDEKHGNYFQEVDPIPIPGPPGSFLPSPGGDIVSEELRSSLTTTSRVQSGDNHQHHDMIDRDSMSTSPISTVSNPSLARSDSKSSDKLSVRSASVQDDIRPGSSGAVVDAAYKKSFPVASSMNSGDWRPVGTSFTEKGPSPTSFKNDQPCCCSRKEGASSQTVASNYQESSLLRRRVLESNRSPSSLNFRSEMFSLSNHPTPPASETVIFPTAKKLPADDSTVRLPVYSDCGSAASPSKPVLRLMGKNLTVVKTDDVSSPSQQLRSPQVSPMSHQNPSQQFRAVQMEDHSSYAHGYPQHLINFSQYQNGSESPHFSAHPPINMRNVDSRSVHGSFMASVDGYVHGSPHLGPTIHQARALHGHNRFNTQAVRERNVYNATSTSKPIKEIIIIDDSPENEAEDAMHNGRVRRHWAPPSLIHNSPGQMNPLYPMYQSQSSAHPYGGGGGSPGFHGGGFQTSLANGNWYCTSAAGSSGMMHPGTLGSRSPSHLRSSTAYYPPSYP